VPVLAVGHGLGHELASRSVTTGEAGILDFAVAGLRRGH